MSAKTITPPQTYSRLFRPWDGKEAKPEVPSGTRSEPSPSRVAGEESDSYSDSDSEQTIKSEPMDYNLSPVKSSELFGTKPPPADPSTMHYPSAEVAAYYQYCYQQQQLQLSEHPMPTQVHPDTHSSIASAVGPFGSPCLPPVIDPLGFSYDQMEQEYMRVLSEDAKAKLLASRKQRPKKFKCPHCNVAFSNNGQLKGHIRIHTGKSLCFGGEERLRRRLINRKPSGRLVRQKVVKVDIENP
uniref:C2H2-type domain-containing protein n=1 Tax=Anopheles dirus TaxID=7168 RepID=A0A182N9X9_9DIPT